MNLGPIELLVVKFPGNRFTGEISQALGDLVHNGTIRIIDLVFAMKTDDGVLHVLELGDLDPDSQSALEPLMDEPMGLLTEDDLVWLAGKIPSGSAAGAMLFENVWATHFADAIVNAHGEVMINERIPRRVIDELAAAAEREPSLASSAD
jgi:Family of unknown function (DUF6325)